MYGYPLRMTRVSHWSEMAGAKIKRSRTLPCIEENSFYSHRLDEGGKDPAEAGLARANCLGLSQKPFGHSSGHSARKETPQPLWATCASVWLPSQ